jgi:hypothetical protein
MPSLPGSDEILKAVLTAAATAVVSRLSGIFEVLTDPNSPRRTLEDAKQTLANMDAGAKVMVQLNQLPPGPWREQMEAKLNDLLKSMEKSQQQCSDELLLKRNKVLTALSLMRLTMSKSFTKGILSFLFYTSLVLTIQSLHLYLIGVRMNGYLIWILSAISLFLWLASGPTISLRRADKSSEPASKAPIPTP